MKDEPRIGFLAPVSSAKRKESDQAQNPEPRTVNNYFTVVIDPKTLLFALMLFMIVWAVLGYAPKIRA